MAEQFSFTVEHELGRDSLARTGIIHTPHGDIETPAFIVVGTKAAVRGMLPETVQEVGAQAVLANTYHLSLRPGAEIVEQMGGLHEFMNWPQPIFTDSGGFQVMSLGSGYKKVVSMDSAAPEAEVVAPLKYRRAMVDDEGVTFKSHLDGSKHRFTAEYSMQVQYALGADITFAFDELTTLKDSYEYQAESLERTHRWAERSLAEVERLRLEHPEHSYQGLFGVLQGANYEDLRTQAARFLGAMSFDGFGIGGAMETQGVGTVARWVNSILPKGKPRHLLGIGEPFQMFEAVEQGVDTFDCVSPTRLARHGSLYTPDGPINMRNKQFQSDKAPLVSGCPCYTCQNYTRAYVNLQLREREMLGATLMSIHNEYFIINLVDSMRQAIKDNSFLKLKEQWLGRYYASKSRQS